MKRPKKGKAGKARSRVTRSHVSRNRASESPQQSYDLLYMIRDGKRVPNDKILSKISDTLEKTKEVYWVEQHDNHGKTIGMIVDNTLFNKKKTEDGAACQSCIELKKTIIQLQNELLEAQGKYLSLLEKVGDI